MEVSLGVFYVIFDGICASTNSLASLLTYRRQLQRNRRHWSFLNVTHVFIVPTSIHPEYFIEISPQIIDLSCGSLSLSLSLSVCQTHAHVHADAYGDVGQIFWIKLSFKLQSQTKT